MTKITLLTGGRTFMQKIASLGPLNAAIVGTTPAPTAAGWLSVALYDAVSGRSGTLTLQGASNNCTEACCCLVADRLIVASKIAATGPDFSKTVLTEFVLAADPFAAPPVFFRQVIYGDSDSRSSELLVLKTGEVVSMTVQHTGMRLTAAVRSGNGNWADQGTVTISTEDQASHWFSMCATPWESSGLWAFDTQDGGRGIAVGIFALENAMLVLKKSIPVFIPSKLPEFGSYFVNGELAALVATADFKGQKINLSYTNTEFTTDEHGVRQQQAYPVAVEIDKAETWKGVKKASEVVVSIKNTLPMCVDDTGLVLSYRVDNPPQLLVSGLNRTPTVDGQIAWHEYRPEFIYTVTGPSPGSHGDLVLARMPGPTPAPPAPDLVESPLSDLSWTAADPTNAGKFMLQWSASATGPWNDITANWAYRFQNPGAKAQVGKVLKVGPNFYRLKPV